MKAPCDILIDSVEVVPLEGAKDPGNGLPWATHQGVLEIGNLKIDVVVLNDGRRLLTGHVVNELLEGLKNL